MLVELKSLLALRLSLASVQVCMSAVIYRELYDKHKFVYRIFIILLVFVNTAVSYHFQTAGTVAGVIVLAATVVGICNCLAVTPSVECAKQKL